MKIYLAGIDLFNKKASVLCTGCPESGIDSTRVKNFLVENNWTITDQLEEADLIIFRACGLTNKDITNSIQVIRQLNTQKKENAKLIVWGCLPKIDIKALRTVYTGITFGENEINILDEILEAQKPIADVTANFSMQNFNRKSPGFNRKLEEYFANKFSIAGSKSVFEIKVSTGCLGNCSFCNVRRSRGLVHSKSIEEIITEFRNGLEKGFRNFGLLATDLGAYGRDLGHNLVDLLAELLKEKGDYRIGLRNINPYFLSEMFETLKPIFASGKIWFLSTAVESGSDRILKLMNRKYQIQEFIECIRILNNQYPNILLRTQLMVGFPTEANKDFRLTMKLIDKLKFDWVEIYIFSPNKGTPASTITDQVPEHTKVTRFWQLYLKTRLQHPQKKIKKIFS